MEIPTNKRNRPEELLRGAMIKESSAKKRRLPLYLVNPLCTVFSRFTDLPVEIIFLILNFCSVRSLLMLRATSTRMYEYVNEILVARKQAFSSEGLGMYGLPSIEFNPFFAYYYHFQKYDLFFLHTSRISYLKLYVTEKELKNKVLLNYLRTNPNLKSVYIIMHHVDGRSVDQSAVFDCVISPSVTWLRFKNVHVSSVSFAHLSNTVCFDNCNIVIDPSTTVLNMKCLSIKNVRKIKSTDQYDFLHLKSFILTATDSAKCTMKRLYEKAYYKADMSFINAGFFRIPFTRNERRVKALSIFQYMQKYDLASSVLPMCMLNIWIIKSLHLIPMFEFPTDEKLYHLQLSVESKFFTLEQTFAIRETFQKTPQLRILQIKAILFREDQHTGTIVKQETCNSQERMILYLDRETNNVTSVLFMNISPEYEPPTNNKSITAAIKNFKHKAFKESDS